MSDEIKKAIKEFQKTNGNSDFTVKEMVQYQIQDTKCRLDRIDKRFNDFEICIREKLDKIDSKFDDGSGKIANNREEIKNLKLDYKTNFKYLYIGVGFAILLAVAAFVYVLSKGTIVTI